MNKMENEWNILLELNNPDRVYFPGQNISGRLALKLETPVKCTNLLVQLHGVGEVMWRVHRSEINVQSTYCAKEEYVNSEIILNEPDPGTANLTLPSGTYSYSFNFHLPANLPSSFNSSIGRITYSITARIKRPWYKFDMKDTKFISIIGLLDLNYPGVQIVNGISMYNGFFMEKSKTICCLCCSSGPVKMEITLPKIIYVPGEDLKFTVEMSNHSSRNVLKTLCSLLQVATFFAEGHQKEIEVCIKSINGPRVSRGSEETWTESSMTNPLRVPPLPPSGLAGQVTIIDVQYILRFEIIFNGCSLALVADAPLKIGTIPHRASFPDFKSQLKTVTESCEDYLHRKSKRGYGIFGLADQKRFNSSQSRIEPENVEFAKAPVFEMYPDIPAFKMVKSSVNLGTVFSIDELEGLFARPNAFQSSEDPKTFHPNCIYYLKNNP